MFSGSRILVIDDEVLVLNLLGMLLREDGFDVMTTPSGERGLELARQSPPDGVILDIKMPGMDGFEVCRRLRLMTDAVIVFVSVKGEAETIVRGLQLGGDDYVVKPYTYGELASRLRACLRRRAARKAPSMLMASGGPGILLDASHRLVFVRDGRSVQLTPKEFELLQLLVANRGRVLSADAILAQVWGPGYVGERDLVKQFIYRLRAKLEPDPTEPRSIVTVRGSGYTFEEETKPTKRPQEGPAVLTPSEARVKPLSPEPAPGGPAVPPVVLAPRPGDSPVSRGGAAEGQPPAASLRRRRGAWAGALAVMALGAALCALSGQASERALPGDALYPLKTGIEDLRHAWAHDEGTHARLHLEFATERLEEASSLLLQNRVDELPTAMAGFELDWIEAGGILSRSSTEGPEWSPLVLAYKEAGGSHCQALQGLVSAAPEGAQPAIRHAFGVLNAASGQLSAPSIEALPPGTLEPSRSPSSLEPMASPGGGIPGTPAPGAGHGVQGEGALVELAGGYCGAAGEPEGRGPAGDARPTQAHPGRDNSSENHTRVPGTLASTHTPPASPTPSSTPSHSHSHTP